MRKKIERNNIYLGDSYELIKLVPDKSIDCIYTDIPYLHLTGGSGKSRVARAITKQNAEIAHISNGIDFEILDDFVRVMKKVNIFIWCSKLQVRDIMNYFLDMPNMNFEILFWGKVNPIPATNNTWLSDTEICLYFREKGVKLNDGYDIKFKHYVSGINVRDKALYDHPTIKPFEIVRNHLLHTTQKGDLVLDAFLGSGTTTAVAKEIGRDYIGFEIEPTYYQIAVDRTNGITARERESNAIQLSLFGDETVE